MSRVAKAPIVLPTNVEFTLDEKATTITIKGPKGALTQHYNKLVNISKDADSANKIIFAPMDDHPNGWAHSGTARANMKNMIKGVTEGFTITLELVGVGYRAQSAGTKVNLSLGFSHPVDYELPKGITAEFPNNTTIVLHGIDKQLLGQTASEIRSYRPPEPYKGKGIKYAGEVIVRKEAKKK